MLVASANDFISKVTGNLGPNKRVVCRTLIVTWACSVILILPPSSSIEILIAGSPPISLSLIVGESKCDARLFFFPAREANLIVVFTHKTEC